MKERIKEDYTKYYDIKKIIGKGAFGYVYKGKLKGKKDEYRAIKVIDLDIIRENLIYEYDTKEIEYKINKCIDGFKKEYENMKICSNENSVKCYEYFYNKNNFVIIMELCDQNLSQLLKDKYLKSDKGFNIEEIYTIMKQLNKGFKVMIENNIIHRDLKLENILIKYKENKEYIIKLADYGNSKKFDSKITSNNYGNSFVGTLHYMAPEILKKKNIMINVIYGVYE